MRGDLSRTFSQLAAIRQRAPQCDLVRVFQMAADGQTVRETRGADAERLDELCHVHRGRLALDGGVRGHDDLLHLAVREALQQLAHGELVGADALHRRDEAVQHVVQTLVFARALEGRDVARRLDHADGGAVARGVRADGAQLPLREVLADLAAVEHRVRVLNGLREGERLLARHREDLICQPRRPLSADAGELRKLLDQPLERLCLICHFSDVPSQPRPGMFRPPVISAIAASDASSTLRTASLTAAAMRSSSISVSSGSMAAGSIFSFVT